MQFHLIDEKIRFDESDSVGGFHAELFHGFASRGGQFPTPDDARLEYKIDRPLVLHKNVYNIADLFAPSGQLVVSDFVRLTINETPNLVFEPVKFGVAWSHRYEPGDFSYWDELRDWPQQATWIAEQKHNPSLLDELQTFFRIVLPPIKELRPKFHGLATLEVTESSFGDPRIVEVNQELLSSVPIYYSDGFVISDGLFRKMSKYINYDYFVHYELSL